MRNANMQLLLGISSALAIIVASAWICGRLARKVGQPAVLGEMISGILLGPTLLGRLAPAQSHYIFSAQTKPTLYTLAMIGLTIYMFLVGVEHHYEPSSRGEALLPYALSVVGFTAPLLLGGLTALFLDQYRPASISHLEFCLFVGGSLSLTAFPMLVRILQERGMMQTRFGGVATRAAAVDDAVAWCLLAVVSAMVVHGSFVASMWTIVPALIFIIVALSVLPRIFRSPIERAVSVGSISDGLFASLLVLVLAAGWFTDYIGIYSVFGGFICGIALPQVPGFCQLLFARLIQVTKCLLLPVFFAYSGLNTDLTQMVDPGLAVAFVCLLLVAFFSKFTGAVAVLRAFNWSWGESVALGGLMNARGLMILIFINVGLQLHIISKELFSVLVLIAVVTTALAMPIYRSYFSDAKEGEIRGVDPSRESNPGLVAAPPSRSIDRASL